MIFAIGCSKIAKEPSLETTGETAFVCKSIELDSAN